MSRFADWLAGGPLLTDGAWGTELQKRGLPPGESPDPWNLQHPERVEAVAAAYCEAGSRIILTNTFRANAVSLPDADIGAINRAGVEISHRAARGRARVIASIGPSGKMLLAGEVTAERLAAAFGAQAQALADAGADGLLVETMSDPEEARIAVRAALVTGLPVVASFVFDTGRNKDRTMTGATPEQVAAAMTAEGVDALGANCGSGIEGFAAICRRLRAACDLPIWIKPNAGLPVWEGGQIVYRMAPRQFAEHVPALLEAGASFIGGCCGTGPEFIQAMAACV
ncbi:MAG: homocysteine S-methyltransferase family protein [Bryobacteraceae bacterium]|jgi:methionine synthase I (cobalamin-dependent)